MRTCKPGLRAKQRSYGPDDKIKDCQLCERRPTRSRYNVFCLVCLAKVYDEVQAQIRVFGPIGS